MEHLQWAIMGVISRIIPVPFAVTNVALPGPGPGLAATVVALVVQGSEYPWTTNATTFAATPGLSLLVYSMGFRWLDIADGLSLMLQPSRH